MSTPQFSLIVFESLSAKEPLQRDLESFFKKFAIPYEILWLPRAEQNIYNFLTTCEKAQAPFIATLNTQLSTPLGDVLKLLQALITDSEIQIVFGERFAKQPEIPGHSVFARILKDRGSLLLQDPFSEYLALKKSSLPLFAAIRENKKTYITAILQRHVQQAEIKYLEVPIIHRSAGEKTRLLELLRRGWFALRF